MSPLEGEDPLSLWFALLPAILGGLIAAYIIWRMVREWRLKRAVDAERPDPLAYADYPELQAMVDRYYVLRYRARLRMSEDAALDARARDERMFAIDRLIEEGLVATDDLRDAEQPEDIADARGRVARITAQLAEYAGEERG